MKLYSIDNGNLIIANVERETTLYYFVDNDRVNRWHRRVNKSEVNAPPDSIPDAHIATTPVGAWQIEVVRTRNAAIRFRELAEKEDRANTAAKAAIEALGSQEAAS